MTNLTQYFLRVFDPTWKVQLFSAKKDFLKQGCVQDGMLQPRSHHFSPPSSQVSREYWALFLTCFNHKLEHHSWYGCQLCLHKNAWEKMKKWRSLCPENRKRDNAFCGTPHYFYISFPKLSLLFNDKHSFSFNKCY